MRRISFGIERDLINIKNIPVHFVYSIVERGIECICIEYIGVNRMTIDEFDSMGGILNPYNDLELIRYISKFGAISAVDGVPPIFPERDIPPFFTMLNMLLEDI